MPSPYDIVNESPYFSDWFDGLHELSPDTELEMDQSLQQLRKTSSKLIKNNFIASSAQLAYINTLLGGTVDIDVSKTTESFEKEVMRFFGETMQGMDINREYSLTQIAEQIITSAFTHGDILINLPLDKRSRRKVKTYVELIEASRIKTPPEMKENNLIKEGVHYYESGRLKGYWVIKNKKYNSKINYYSAKKEDFKFFPAYKTSGNLTRRVCWLFKAPLNLRPGQSRGIPVLTGSMGLLRYTNQYLEAVLVGARVAACFAGFISTDNPAQARKDLTEAGEDVNIKIKGQKKAKLQPGMLSYLRKGESITFASPNRPSDNFDNYVLRLAKFVAMTVRIPYQMLFLDMSEANYSNYRGGTLEVERNINRWRRDLSNCLRWIIFTFLQEGLVRGALKGTLKGMILKITLPVYKTLDEEKSARARKVDLATNSTSQHRIQAGLGLSYEELLEELKKEALDAVEREAEVLKRKKELSEEYEIVFSDQEEQNRDTSTSRREGEAEGEDLDEDDAKERRKEDGNW